MCAHLAVLPGGGGGGGGPPGARGAPGRGAACGGAAPWHVVPGRVGRFAAVHRQVLAWNPGRERGGGGMKGAGVGDRMVSVMDAMDSQLYALLFPCLRGILIAPVSTCNIVLVLVNRVQMDISVSTCILVSV